MAKRSEPSDARAEGEPAVRDAAEILARAATDEAAADEARQRYRVGPIPPIQAGTMIQDLLEPGEFVVATVRGRSSIAGKRRRGSAPRPA